MNVVIADIRQNVIDDILPIFSENGWSVFGIKLNVLNRDEYAKAVDTAEAHFGNIHLLVNNAGISCANGPLWEVSPAETDLAVDVNLIGVLNGVQTVVPRMLKHGEVGHVVSTASKAALLPVPRCGLYNMTKQAVVGMMETLAMDLEETGIGVSVFCPGGYQTNLRTSSNDVKAELLGDSYQLAPPLQSNSGSAPARNGYDEVIRSADDAGERVVRGVKRGDLYILTHSEFKNGVDSRFNAILRAFPDEIPNPRYSEVLPMLTYNAIFDKQSEVPALKK